MPLLALLLFGAFQSTGPEPRIVHAQMEPRQVSGALEAEFRAIVQAHQDASWIAYTVPRAPRGGDSCHDSTATPGRPVMLEGARQAVILFRVERREVVRIRAFASDCELDAGDLPMVWLNGVSPQDSIRLLETFAHPAEGVRQAERLAPSAIYAIGAHSDARALDLLMGIAKQEKRSSLRSAAFQAIGRLRDPRATAFLEDILRR